MKEELKDRTKKFAIDCCLWCENLPKRKVFNVLQNQVLRSATSVGANYRAACRAKSNADFINKLKIVEEEADETMYFLEIIMNMEQKRDNEAERLHKEADEILSIMVASIKTLRNRNVQIVNRKP